MGTITAMATGTIMDMATAMGLVGPLGGRPTWPMSGARIGIG
ncbi:hypothetical protein DB31_4993 [Hyalangium minutum]|uniref:Uncharacterized protein n=1 Tax=Hyalangium minutum TaxID=394096 RepID=A0A085WQI8_9BACT|nr:hypothetical protein DB31_4993 [Hyalangium minutum]